MLPSTMDGGLRGDYEVNMNGEPCARKPARTVRKGTERKGLITVPRSQSTLHPRKSNCRRIEPGEMVSVTLLPLDLLCGQGDSTELEQHCENVFGEPGAGDLSVTDRVNADTEPCGTLASSRSAKERADLCATVSKTDHNLVASRDYLVDAQVHVGESASGVGGHELFVGLDAPDLSQAAALPDHVCGPQLVDQVLPAAVDDFVEEAAHNCDVAAVVLIIGGYVNHCPLHLLAGANQVVEVVPWVC